MVDVGVLLGGVDVVGVDEDGGVAALDEAVVEEEAESASGGGGLGQLLLGHGLPDYFLEIRARFCVVIFGEDR